MSVQNFEAFNYEREQGNQTSSKLFEVAKKQERQNSYCCDFAIYVLRFEENNSMLICMSANHWCSHKTTSYLAFKSKSFDVKIKGNVKLRGNAKLQWETSVKL